MSCECIGCLDISEERNLKVKKLNRYYRAEKRRIVIPGQSDVSGSLKCRRLSDPEAALLPAAQAVILGNIIIADH